MPRLSDHGHELGGPLRLELRQHFRGSGAATAYGYDAVSRLTSLSQDLAGSSDDQAYAFAYNPAGQLVGRTAANAAYAWAGTAQDQPNVLNGLNQYVSVNAVAYGYDARGNLTSGPKTFTYDAQDRLLTVSGSRAACRRLSL